MGKLKNLTLTEIRKAKFAHQIGKNVSNEGDGVLADGFFEKYSDDQSYEDGFEEAFNGKYIIDLIKAIWNFYSSFKLLDCGSANGLTFKAIRGTRYRSLGHRKQRLYTLAKRWRICANETCLVMCVRCHSRTKHSTFFMSRACLTCPKKRSVKQSKSCFGYVV